jgi:hypothetical protein
MLGWLIFLCQTFLGTVVEVVYPLLTLFLGEFSPLIDIVTKM